MRSALSEKISNDGDTALHIAFLGGHMDIVKVGEQNVRRNLKNEK